MLELVGKARVGRYSRKYALYLDDELSRALAGYKGRVRVFFDNMVLRLKPSRIINDRVILFLPHELDEMWAMYYDKRTKVVIRLG